MNNIFALISDKIKKDIDHEFNNFIVREPKIAYYVTV